MPNMLAVLDFSTIKNELFPIVASVFTKTSSLAIKVRGLEAFVTLCGGIASPESSLGNAASAPNSAILDKYTVQEKIVPLLKGMKTKEPAVMMAALKVFREVGKIADTEFLATDILPLAWSFSLGPLLNLQQFKEYMDLIKQLSSKIEDEQTRKLRELASTSQPNGFLSPTTDLMSSGLIGDPLSPSNATSASDFENLVLGKPTASTNASHSASTTTVSNPFGAHPGSPISNSSVWSSNPAIAPTSGISRAITPDNFPSFQTTPANSSTLPTRPLQPLNPTSPPANPWASPPHSGGMVTGNSAWSASPPQTGSTAASNNAWNTSPPQTGLPSLSPNAWTSQPSQSSSSGFVSMNAAVNSTPSNAWTGQPQSRPAAPTQSQSFAGTGMGGLQAPLQPSNSFNMGNSQQLPQQQQQQPSLFTIAPPPPGPGLGRGGGGGGGGAGNSMGMSTGMQMNGNVQGKKTGLDAYESLI